MNKNNIITADGCDLEVTRTTYAAGGTAVILTTTEGEPYAVLSVNLSAYGLEFPDDTIAVDPDMMNSTELINAFMNKFGIKPENGKYEEVTYGPFNTKSYVLKIKPDEIPEA